MKLSINKRRNAGNFLLGGLLLLVAFGLAGCAVYEMLHRIRDIDERRHRQATNDPPEFGVVLPPDQTHGGPTYVAGPGVLAAPPWQPGTNYNEALEDESGQ